MSKYIYNCILIFNYIKWKKYGFPKTNVAYKHSHFSLVGHVDWPQSLMCAVVENCQS